MRSERSITIVCSIYCIICVWYDSATRFHLSGFCNHRVKAAVGLNFLQILWICGRSKSQAYGATLVGSCDWAEENLLFDWIEKKRVLEESKTMEKGAGSCKKY